ncbi:MAG: primosomal protein N' [Alphaproteobacteria bacterium]|nr:primosomal protein N' [Alphaproteobacteria bacterium]
MPRSHASSDPGLFPAQAAAGGDRVRVLLPLALPGPLDYRAAPEAPLCPGAFVRVPLGARERIGVVWDPPEQEVDGDFDDTRLKDVLAVLDAPPLTDTMRRFIDWVAAYTVSPPGMVLKMAMSMPKALVPETRTTAYSGVADWRPGEKFRLTPQRRKVIDLLATGPPRMAADIRTETGVGMGVINGLVAAGALKPQPAALPSPFAAPDPDRPGPALTPVQTQAAVRLRNSVARGGFAVTLLDGVTGSGKTEVYFEAIAEALRDRRQALVLLPEIALSAQWLERFTRRFGAEPALWHSDLSQGRRRRTWRAVAEGQASVVVGARSALFLPFPDLGLIVVDEEHDGSYKQEDGVHYSARDMAVVRGHLADLPVILVSATPSLETVVNVERGRYAALHLPERIGGAALPEVTLVDLRRFPPPAGHWLAPPLVEALGKTLANHEQALLFLNRRGYAPLTLCRSCGHRLECANCSAWLVQHRASARLVCHHCGFAMAPPEACSNCEAEGSFAACGPGVERIAEEVCALFPDARRMIMASDTLSGPRSFMDIVAAVAAGEVDVLIGTQIIAKGHHFPDLTLVGVVDADLGLSGGDLRASERTHQLLTQVAGRAGRAEKPGRVLVQTYMPEHPVMAALASGDRDAFLGAEKAAREAAGMPPFGRLAALIVSGPRETEVDATAAALARVRPGGDGLEVLGPAPAAMRLLRGRHRRRFLVKADRNRSLQPVLRDWLARVRPGKGVRIQVDVDPVSFL